MHLRYFMVCALATGVALISSTASAAGDIDCSTFEITVTKPRIAFEPFPMEDLETGRPYQPGDLIEFQIDGQTRTMTARDYFSFVNSVESYLSDIGYSLRNFEDATTIKKLFYCAEILQGQDRLIDESLRELFEDPTSFENWKAKLEASWQVYRDVMIPNWDQIREAGDNQNFDFYFPDPPPVYNPPVPSLEPIPIQFDKEKSWSFQKGEKAKFMVSGSAGYYIKGNKAEVKAGANAALKGAVVGNELNMLDGNVYAQSFGTERAKAGISVKVFGREVWGTQHNSGALWEYKKRVDKTIDKSWTFRATIGPIPVAARVGFRGGVGLDFGVAVVPFQVNAYATPFAFADAYAEAGVDIVIAGGGVGGHLVFIQLAIPIQGNVALQFNDTPELLFSLKADAEITALKGSLYLYVYFYRPAFRIPPWKKEKLKYDFFSWDGFGYKGSIFAYHGKLGRHGLQATGDLSPEDFSEMQAINTLAEWRLAVEELERKAYDLDQEIIGAIEADLAGPNLQNAFNRTAGLMALLDAEDQKTDAWVSRLQQAAAP